jgi:WD40 repeat protein
MRGVTRRARLAETGRRLVSSGLSGDADPLQPEQAGDGEQYRVDARGARGLLVGDQGTQVNYFYQGTWTDGVAPAPLVGMSGAIDSPYRGLGAFGERDAALFFGREAAAGQVLELMARHLEGTGLVVVSGVSGAGKSSLLRAGVLPRLRGAGLGPAPEAASWPCLVFTPGRGPLQELAVRVAPAAGADAAAILPRLAADPAGFALTARQAALARLDGVPERAGQRRVLFVVDQFEQLFTQCQDEDERQAFITALHAAAGGGRQAPAAMVVLLVRADFEARLADYPLLAPPVQDRYLLTAMTELQLRMAITQPTAVAGSSVDEDLVQVLLQEARARPGSAADPGSPVIGAGVLPLLSHALDQAWRQRAGGALTLADYERTGGIEGAVAGSAQRAYDRLTTARQATARQVFTRLTATAGDGADTAVRATRADLTAGKDVGQVREVEAVLETFAAERLLTLAGGTVEISHEVLLTAWPLLRDTWLADTRADRAVRTRLQATAGEWDRVGRDPSYLYGGSRLEAAAQAAARIGADARQAPLGQAEEDFLRASRQAGRRRSRRRQGIIAALLALAVGLTVVSVAAVRASQATAGQRDIADYQRDVAASGELASDSEALDVTNATASQIESIAAWGIDPSGQAYYAMLADAASSQTATLTGGSGPVGSVAFSPDGKTLATADDGTVKLWDTATRHQIHSLATGSDTVESVAFSPDGRILATGDSDGTAKLWNTATSQQIRTLVTTRAVGFSGVDSVAFSPDGKTLATAGTGVPAQLWNAATGQPIRTLITGFSGVDSVAFSPDGKTLATAGTSVPAQQWNMATGQRIRTLASSLSGVESVVFSPDGKTLAAAEDYGTALLWNATTGQQIHTLTTGSSGVNSMAFSPDGKTLATADNGGTQLWNVADGRQIGSPLTGVGAIVSVAFSPDGETLATGDDDGTARLWNTATGQQTHTLTTGFNVPRSVAFSPDGNILATADGDGTARLWNTATGQQIRTLVTGLEGVNSVAFSPDGKTLATASSGDAAVRLLNTDTGQRIRTLALTRLLGVDSVVFSPDGKTLAAAGVDGTVQLWSVTTGQQVHTLRTGADKPGSAVFSPDGKTLATNGIDGTAQLWNAVTGQQIRTLATGTYSVDSVAFSRDGKTLATGDSDGTVRLWNLATEQQIRTLATGSSALNSVAFSPDGKTLATASSGDGTVRLWNLATEQQIRTLATGSSTVESVVFSPDGKTLATADDDGMAQLWNVGYLVDVLARLCSQVGGSLTQAEWAHYVPSGPTYRNVCAQHS